MDEYRLCLESDEESTASAQARNLADELRQITGIERAEREKKTEGTMDLGTVISILATSGATLALAQGIADWLRSRRGTKLIVERDASSGSLKATIEGIDPESAKQVIEGVTRL
ncbi:hypothetical protein J8I87_36240 [Paraburkholderia sp. LEh10]|uniref:effector-associated constant component EACC1 n=1 Tax=Paraburkholderia sp. LEh10 TaxID=2821353 RepID=UPI001AE56514|nr:hypothetical protein [Paraburkholderia sp. LEh10]MBP0595020.1 hypothetical protein [Paraburkholderia sp. LEh10]